MVGAECFSIPGPRCAFPYKLDAHDFSRGPMGYGMGKLQIIQQNGNGGLRLTECSFVVVRDRACVDLDTVVAPLRQRVIRQSAAAAQASGKIQPPLKFLVRSDIANVHIVPMPMTFRKNGPGFGLAGTF